MQHLVLAVRSLSRTPLATMAAVLTLALAIGANTAIFSMAYGVLMRPLPFSDPSALVQFTSRVQPDGRRTGFAAPEVPDWTERLGRTAAIAGYGVSPFTISGEGDAEALRGAVVSEGSSLYSHSISASAVHWCVKTTTHQPLSSPTRFGSAVLAEGQMSSVRG